MSLESVREVQGAFASELAYTTLMTPAAALVLAEALLRVARLAPPSCPGPPPELSARAVPWA